MTQLFFAALLFVLAGFDSWLTQKRIRRYGLQVELNKAIRWLSKAIGPELASILGIMTPTCALIALAVLAHLQWVLPLLVGFRLRQFFIQCESLVFERQIKELAASLAATSSGSRLSLPPGCSAQDGVEPKTTPTLSSEDKDEHQRRA